MSGSLTDIFIEGQRCVQMGFLLCDDEYKFGTIFNCTCIKDSVSSFRPADHLHHFYEHSLLHHRENWGHFIRVTGRNSFYNDIYWIGKSTIACINA